MSEHAGALAHHFEDLEQQREAHTLGMWAFLITEVMFFGGLFAGYAVYRHAYPEAYAAASRMLDVKLGGINTAVLIGSSFTMVLAVHAAQQRRRVAIAAWLWATIVLGTIFLGVKYFEYSEKWHHHLIPGPHFVFEGKPGGHEQLFFAFYFAMTGLHAFHMIIGIGIMSVMLWLASTGTITAEYYSPVEVSGLYWHFVDLVWIFLFPLLYLIGRHS